ncbi:MAG: hypothetical protein K2K93_03095 [Muribaculaceae bacterium]|nr:hypothetical protein [Muribaculaceae bacterium]
MNDRIKSLASDTSLSIDDRIEAMFSLREETEGWDFSRDITAFKSLIQAIRDEGDTEAYMLDLLQLYTLLAETYADHNDYRPLLRLSVEVRGILNDESIAWEVLEETLPRLIEAVAESVYQHETYMLLLLFIRRAYEKGRLGRELKPQVSHLLKLHTLLEDPDRHGYWLDKGLQAVIATLFTSEELLQIMINPVIGHLKVDPVEYTRRWEEIYYDVEDRLKLRFADEKRRMGFCFMYWSAKQDLLKKVYGIDWRSPSEMNPRVMFD